MGNCGFSKTTIQERGERQTIGKTLFGREGGNWRSFWGNGTELPGKGNDQYEQRGRGSNLDFTSLK